MGFPILVRRHLYIESGPRRQFIVTHRPFCMGARKLCDGTYTRWQKEINSNVFIINYMAFINIPTTLLLWLYPHMNIPTTLSLCLYPYRVINTIHLSWYTTWLCHVIFLSAYISTLHYKVTPLIHFKNCFQTNTSRNSSISHRACSHKFEVGLKDYTTLGHTVTGFSS